MAARAQPIYTVQQHPIPEAVAHRFDDQQFTRMFVDAAQQNGWRVLPASPGHLNAAITIRRSHSLTVDISYNRSAFSITLISSERLKQENGRIHPAANRAIHDLEGSIEAAISRRVSDPLTKA